jgi:hypothetical protein
MLLPEGLVGCECLLNFCVSTSTLGFLTMTLLRGIAPAARISLLKLAAREDASRRTADRSEHPLLLSEMALTILRHGWAPTARNKFSVYYDRSQHGY